MSTRSGHRSGLLSGARAIGSSWSSSLSAWFPLLVLLPSQTVRRDQGLLSDNVLNITQDSEDFFWIGSPQGVSVYDGISFHTFTGAGGLAESSVRQVLEIKIAPTKTLVVLLRFGYATTGPLRRWNRTPRPWADH